MHPNDHQSNHDRDVNYECHNDSCLVHHDDTSRDVDDWLDDISDYDRGYYDGFVNGYNYAGAEHDEYHGGPHEHSNPVGSIRRGGFNEAEWEQRPRGR